MSKRIHIHIRVLNPVAAAIVGSNEEEMVRLAQAAGPNTDLSFRYTYNAPESIEGDYEDALAVPGTVRAAIEAQQEGADGIVINCTADTGVAACRECVTIPVVAPAQASMHLAAQLAHRFSVLTFLQRTIPRFEEMAWRWGLGHRLSSVRSVEVPVLSVQHDREKLARDLFAAGRLCVEQDGAHALILGCTAFEDVSDLLRLLFDEAGIAVLVLEPYVVAVRQAEALVTMNLSHSKLTYPPPKQFESGP